jgi:hypothetical protein
LSGPYNLRWDAAQRIDVAVAAKLGLGRAQYAEQWRNQWLAYHGLRANIGDAAEVF